MPAALAAAADPIASLIDTAFIGHLGIDLSLAEKKKKPIIVNINYITFVHLLCDVNANLIVLKVITAHS